MPPEWINIHPNLCSRGGGEGGGDLLCLETSSVIKSIWKVTYSQLVKVAVGFFTF